MPTGPRPIQTASGPAAGSIFAKMEILGIASYLTQTGNRPNAQKQWEEIVGIAVPVGTQAIVASQDQWALGFGALTSLLDPFDPSVNPSWNSEDHNWGLGRASMRILEVAPPDFSVSPPKQTARIVVRMNLLDHNGDDSWFGVLGYTLTFLGFANRKGPLDTNTVTEGDRKIVWSE
jgi:hypothetical protein